MHDLMLQEVIKTCRQRDREGDCSITKAFSVEVLEQAVVQLAGRVQILLDPDIESDAGASHWEAPMAKCELPAPPVKGEEK